MVRATPQPQLLRRGGGSRGGEPRESPQEGSRTLGAVPNARRRGARLGQWQFASGDGTYRSARHSDQTGLHGWQRFWSKRKLLSPARHHVPRGSEALGHLFLSRKNGWVLDSRPDTP